MTPPPFREQAENLAYRLGILAETENDATNEIESALSAAYRRGVEDCMEIFKTYQCVVSTPEDFKGNLEQMQTTLGKMKALLPKEGGEKA